MVNKEPAVSNLDALRFVGGNKFILGATVLSKDLIRILDELKDSEYINGTVIFEPLSEKNLIKEISLTTEGRLLWEHLEEKAYAKSWKAKAWNIGKVAGGWIAGIITTVLIVYLQRRLGLSQ